MPVRKCINMYAINMYATLQIRPHLHFKGITHEVSGISAAGRRFEFACGDVGSLTLVETPEWTHAHLTCIGCLAAS